MQNTDRTVSPRRSAARESALGDSGEGTSHGLSFLLRRWIVTLVMMVAAVFWLLPVIWVVVNSFKLTPNIIRLPPEWIPWPITAEHYWQVLFGAFRSARIGRAFVNSGIIAVGSVALVLLTSAMAAYPLARMRFPGRNLIFALLVGSLMVPNVVTLVPQYMLVQQLGWLSTYQGLIVPEAATVLAFGIFLLRQFFLGIPTELEDAARIDGANAWQIFSRVILPLSHPAFAALSIFAFRSAWNDFLWPLIAVNKADMFTLPVALAFLRGAYMNESYGPIMAGAVLSALPLLIVFLFANRRIVEGVQLSGLKG